MNGHKREQKINSEKKKKNKNKNFSQMVKHSPSTDTQLQAC